MSVTTRLAEHAVGLRTAPLPEAVRLAARRALVDWFAAALPGAVEPPATLLVEALGDDLDRGEARLLPDGRRATDRTAALINGAAAHTVEFDDIYRDAVYHPGAPTIAAALAVAQDRGADGEALLRAVVAGYEISTRVARTLGPAHYEYWHTTGTAGGFGAATAAGLLLGLDARALDHALAQAATFAAALQQAFRADAMSKPLHAARAAECGVLVARMAGAGVTGAPRMLEGERGLGAAMSRDADWTAAVADLDEAWQITRMTQKNHGCCGHTFAALDAAIALRREHRFPPEAVRAVRVATYGKALEVTGNREPRTPAEARFSLAYCLARALVSGRVRLDAFTPERIAEPAVRALMSRVSATIDPEADAAFPRARAARVEVELADGRRLHHHAPTRKGDPDDPLEDSELGDKLIELAGPVLGEPAAQVLLDRLWALEKETELRALWAPALPRAASGAG